MNKNGDAKFLIIFGLGWALFSSIFLLIGIFIVRSETDLHDRFSNEGKVARAIITDLEIDHSNDSTGYYVYYEFKAPVNGDATLFKSSAGVSSAFYNELRVDQPIDVIYIPSDPNISQLKAQFGPPNIFVGWFFGGLGSLFMLIGLTILIFGLRSKFAS